MRKWVLAGMGVLVLIGIAAGVALRNVGAYVAEHRGWIEAQAERALGRPVSFGDVGISVLGGVGAEVADLTIGDDPAFSSDDFVHADAVRVVVRLLPALFGRYEVRRLVLDRPRVRLVVTDAGLNATSIGRRTVDTEAAMPKPGEVGGVEGGAESTRAAALVVGLLTVRDGTVRLLDRRAGRSRELVAEHLDVEISNLGIGRRVGLEGAVALLGADQQNVRVSGTIGPLAAVDPAAATPVDLAVDVEAVEVAALRDAALEWLHAVPALDGITLGGTLGFDLGVRGRLDAPQIAGSARLSRVAVRWPDGPAIDGLTTTVSLADGGAEMPPTSLRVAGVPVELTARVADVREPLVVGTIESTGGEIHGTRFEHVTAAYTASPIAVELRDIVLDAWGGRAEGRLALDRRDADTPSVAAVTRVRDMDITAVAAVVAPGAARNVSGRLEADLDVEGHGAAWDQLSQTLEGAGRVTVRQGALEGVNLAEQVLTGATGIPGVGTLVPGRVRTKYPELFGAAETRFEELRSTFRITGGGLRFDDLAVAARDYRITGAGRLSFTGQLDATGVLTVSKQLSDHIVGSVKEVALITDKDGRLSIPFGVTGRWPSVRVRPDTSRLMRSLQLDLIQRGLEELFGRTRDKPATKKSRSKRKRRSRQ